MKRCNKCNVMHDGAHVCNWPCPDHDDYWSGCAKCERAAAISEHAPLLAKLADTAVKHDQNKLDLSLIPLIAQKEEAKAFMVGLSKYGRYGYYNGMAASEQISSLIHHALRWFEGEEYDKDDGQHHLGAVRARAAIILKQIELGTLKDDRHKK